ncbi:MAG: squalene/phytoene synthase family protein [Chthoniobacterales bacterium]|nr:squalene/phytoene synthase family protein [Chthoniobacterales bacterium]
MDAKKITRQSKSNLALAFFSLDRERREDITTFYAFCRIVDDIADAEELSVPEKAAALGQCRRSLRAAGEGEPALAPAVRGLMAKYPITPEMLEEILAGVEMDLTITRYDTFEDLRLYCYRVASAVGLVSIEIFGYRNPACREYAVQLGLALQTTNIIRDVAKDLRIGRIYLPREELEQFEYTEADLQARRYDRGFCQLMEFQAQRSRGFYRAAAERLPAEDRRSMAPAEVMGAIYRGLLAQMERDGFRVFEKDYRLNRLQKAGYILAQRLGWRRG